MVINKEVKRKILSKEGHILFLSLLGAVSEIELSSRKEFLKEAIRLDVNHYNDSQIEEMAEDTLQVNSGKRPMPEYCTGFKNNLSSSR